MALQAGNVGGNPPGGLALPPAAGPGAPPSRIWPPDLKELTTTVIALVIVSITTWMIFRAFSNVGDMHPQTGDPPFDKEAFSRSKDILAFALGLFGTVTGYYFGRVPAEKQADAARHSADVAKQGQAAAESKTQQVRTFAKDRIKDIINSNAPTQEALLNAAGPAFQQSHAGITGQLTSLLAEL